MTDEINQAIEAYDVKWRQLGGERKDGAFFAALKSTAVAWKTEDLEEFNARLAQLQPLCEQVHVAWVNDRWLGTLYLRDTLADGIRIVKLMQRRPNSTDAVGLDHLDFLLPKNSDAKNILTQEIGVKWTEEKNGDHCKWLSIWFDDTEAKLRSDTVLQVCADEMLECQKQLTENV